MVDAGARYHLAPASIRLRVRRDSLPGHAWQYCLSSYYFFALFFALPAATLLFLSSACAVALLAAVFSTSTAVTSPSSLLGCAGVASGALSPPVVSTTLLSVPSDCAGVVSAA